MAVATVLLQSSSHVNR